MAWQFEFIELGLAAALKAKISAERIVNFLLLRDFAALTESAPARDSLIWNYKLSKTFTFMN